MIGSNNILMIAGRLCFIGVFCLVARAGTEVESGQSSISFYNQLPEELKKISEFNAGTTLSISGQEQFVKAIEMAPRNTAEVIQVVRYLRHGRRKVVIGAGNFKNVDGVYQGLSIGAHAQGLEGDVYLSTRNLKTHRLKTKDYAYFPADKTIVITVRAGTSWGDATTLANKTLSKEDRKKYRYLPLSAPTTRRVSIGGSLASHTVSRTSAFGVGFMPDTVESFELVAVKNNKVRRLKVSRYENPKLFYALPGSFGRGGIITKVTLSLQRVPRNMRVVTTVRKYKDASELVTDFKKEISYGQQMAKVLDPSQRSFNSSYVTVTDRGRFYLYSNRLSLKSEAKHLPKFYFFEGPTFYTSVMQASGHSQTRLANRLVDVVNAGPTGQMIYKNSLVSWVFPQDSYLAYLKQYPKVRRVIKVGSPYEGDHLKLAHQAYVLPADKLLPVIEIAKRLQKKLYRSHGIVCKMEDIAPMPSSKFIMAPTFGQNQKYFIYTFTWPIRSQRKNDGVQLFKKKLLKYADRDRRIGPGVLKSHMLKEFEKDTPLLYDTYKEQIDMLNETLSDNHLDDSFLWSHIFGALYQIKRDERS